jgi:o-succinylbenzoate---CoA ligase
VSWLSEQAERRPNARAVRCGDVELTYAELAERAGRAAAALAAAGAGPGDRVAVRLPDGLPLVVAIHAVAWLGAVLVPIHHRWGEEETEAALGTGSLRGRVRSHRTAHRVLLMVDDPTILQPDQDIAIPEPSPQPDDALATVLYTSGTTGAPRPVPLTHGNHRASAEASAAHLDVDPDDAWLCPLPLPHVGGLAIVLRSVLYGTAFTLVPASSGFDPEAVARRLASGEVTLASLVPTMLRRLLDLPEGPRPHERLRAILLGGGPADPELVERALDAGYPVRTTYGMTETASQVVTMPGGDAPRRKLGAAGVPLSGVELDVEEGTGAVRVRGAMVSAASANPEGWLTTGDLGRIDADGFLWIEGRHDQVIVTGGENVSPAEVENVLRRHPQVADCAVLGLPDPEWGHTVAAAIVPRDPHAPPTPGDLTAWCRQHLAGFKVPKRWVVLEELPRTPSGKVTLEALRSKLSRDGL